MPLREVFPVSPSTTKKLVALVPSVIFPTINFPPTKTFPFVANLIVSGIVVNVEGLPTRTVFV